MIHLIQRGLMFGNLFHIASPALIERYNRALKHLTNHQTKLSEFHIDVSGYSPEIGDELDDHLYLNHAGVNRQFILLTTDQKSAPLLNAKFSTSREILKEFISKNEPQLFALTARDAVAGDKGSPSLEDINLMKRFWFDGDSQFAEISTLSGGERRRLQLLLTLIEQPNVLLLDEPTSGLDDLNTEVILKVLSDFVTEGKRIAIICTHDTRLDRIAHDIVDFNRFLPLEGHLEALA